MRGVAVVLACFSLIALLLAWSRWLARRRLASAGHVLLAIAAGWGAVLLWSILASLDTYVPVVHGQPVADVYLEQTGSRSYRAVLTRLPAGRVQVFEVDGDQRATGREHPSDDGRRQQAGRRQNGTPDAGQEGPGDEGAGGNRQPETGPNIGASGSRPLVFQPHPHPGLPDRIDDSGRSELCGVI